MVLTVGDQNGTVITSMHITERIICRCMTAECRILIVIFDIIYVRNLI